MSNKYFKIAIVVLIGILGYISFQFIFDSYFSLSSREIIPLKGKFLTYTDLKIPKKGYICVNSTAEFQNLLIKQNEALLNNSPSFSLDDINTATSIEELEYFSLEFSKDTNFFGHKKIYVLNCRNFVSKEVLMHIKTNEVIQIGYATKSLNQFSFNNLINFLISANILSDVPKIGFMLSLENYYSKIRENSDEIIRTDTSIFRVDDDTSNKSSKEEETHIYRYLKNNKSVYFQTTNQFFTY